MGDVKTLVKSVTRCNKRETLQSRSIERKFKRQIGRCQANYTKMGYIVETTSKEIKEEQAEIMRARMDEEQRIKEEEERRIEAKRQEVMRLRAKVEW